MIPKYRGLTSEQSPPQNKGVTLTDNIQDKCRTILIMEMDLSYSLPTVSINSPTETKKAPALFSAGAFVMTLYSLSR